ncbi:MAG: hypothetical protein ACMUEL_02420 [Flavobacteriales bacterium Tduv]
MIVNASITVIPICSPRALLPTKWVGEEGRGAKANQSKKINGKKATRSRVNSKGKWLKKSGKIYYGYKKHIGMDKNGMILSVRSLC